MFADLRLSKLDIARFYERIAPWILPHVRGRPLTLVRCPRGATDECYYMKHSKVWAPSALRRVRIQEKKKVVRQSLAAAMRSVRPATGGHAAGALRPPRAAR